MRWEVVRADARGGEASDRRSAEANAGAICGPGVRWGHSCNAVQGGRFLYVFGGYGRDRCQTNDVHVFDTVKQSWSKPTLKGIPPSPRDSHSCTTVGDKLFVFGGTDGKNPLKDTHILDTSSNTWILPNLYGEGPEAREGHSAVFVGKRLFIFGGCGKSETNEEKYYNDTYILDIEKLSWEQAVTSGSPPSARDCHSCSSWKNQIIVLGGEDSSGCYLSDVHILIVDTLVWQPMKTSGKIFPPRAGHTTVPLGNDLFVFGGFSDAKNLYDDLYVLNLEKQTWSKVVPDNQGPCGRFSVAGECLDYSKGIIAFLGGCNEFLDALDDMYYLHTVNGLYDQRLKRPSIRRELRKRCQQEGLLSPRIRKDDKLLKHHVEYDLLNHPQKTNLAGKKVSDQMSAGEVKFEARVINVNRFGYAIETTIDGKLLHGMLFSSTSNISIDNHTHYKKRMVDDNVSNQANLNQPTGATNISAERERISDPEQPDNPHVEGPKLCSPSVEIFGSNLTNITPCGKAPGNVDQDSRAPGDKNNEVSDSQKIPVDLSENRSLPAEADATLLNDGSKQGS
ncbi:host cell factor-like isoform X1 [Zingiber officinale]|uniref:host cell factor-like isoform X1 n=1 Tax=Zingiber officinale TaxID=94328 RepID=UPI001C4D220F|nr:host cell factor-like isoform X1 [Zingiber officinale]